MRRYRRLFRAPRAQDELGHEAEEEIEFHVEQTAARLEREGMSKEEARAEAIRRFGDLGRITDEVEALMRKREDARRKSEYGDGARRNVSFALRQMSRSPGFSTIAALTIAIAIGATTSVFSVVDGIMLRPLPFDEPEELVMVWMDFTRRDVVLPDKRREWLSWPNFMDFRDEVEAIEHASAFMDWNPTLTGIDGGALRMGGGAVSYGMFSRVLRAEAALGRTFLPEEDRVDGTRVVVLSDGLWARAFGRDPTILESTIRLDDVPHRVVGVMPPGFRPPGFLGTDLWTTLRFEGGEQPRGSIFLRAVGRLVDGASVGRARTEATQLASRLEGAYPDTNRATGFNVYPLHSDMVQQASTGLWLLLGAVALVLVIACVNVANLLLARGATRGVELAVRTAIGARRSRILAQLITESLLLAIVGGALGTGLAFIGTEAILRLAPTDTPLLDQVTVDARILGFAFVVTLLTGALFGVLPAVRASRTDPASALRGGAGGSDTAASARLRSGLVVGQIAIALMLLVGAGLLIRSFQNLQRVDLGFDPSDVVVTRIQLPAARYPDATARIGFLTELEGRLAAIPGVEEVGSITNLPLAGADGDTDFQVEGAPPAEPGLEPAVWLRRATPDYFDALDLPIVAGRGFTASDDAQAPRVIIVNETLERDFFGGSALGRRLNVNDPENPVWREVVGVAKDIRNFGIRADSRNSLYIPFAQAPTGFFFNAIETSGDPTAAMTSIRGVLAELDPELALGQLEPMEELVSSSLAVDRFTTSLLSGFAAVALLLALVGLYGIVSYTVSTRLREMGVRIALGAPTSDIRALVLGWALRLAVGGIALGALGAAGITRLVEGLLFGVGSTDLPTFSAAALLMAGATVLASLVPAVRATRIDPIRVLKSE